MNELNYGSLEACKRLKDAGIEMEDVEAMWFEHEVGDWILLSSDSVSIKAFQDGHAYPAPSLAEIWRELPDGEINCIISNGGDPFYTFTYGRVISSQINPTDALIDLLIWVEKGGRE